MTDNINLPKIGKIYTNRYVDATYKPVHIHNNTIMVDITVESGTYTTTIPLSNWVDYERKVDKVKVKRWIVIVPDPRSYDGYEVTLFDALGEAQSYKEEYEGLLRTLEYEFDDPS